MSICPLPSTEELAAIFAAATLPRALSEVDRLVFAAAIHHQIAVVTADRRLARAIVARQYRTGDMALILRELVLTKRLSRKICENGPDRSCGDGRLLARNASSNVGYVEELFVP